MLTERAVGESQRYVLRGRQGSDHTVLSRSLQRIYQGAEGRNWKILNQVTWESSAGKEKRKKCSNFIMIFC